MIGTNVKELKIPPNNPVGQRAYDAVAKAAEGEIVSFTYDFPKPGTKAPAPKETLEVRPKPSARAKPMIIRCARLSDRASAVEDFRKSSAHRLRSGMSAHRQRTHEFATRPMGPLSGFQSFEPWPEQAEVLGEPPGDKLFDQTSLNTLV
jgi:hypothetical protein